MGGETWSLTAKPCDSCKTAPSAVFCRADSAFLCLTCDAEIHAANKLASRHAANKLASRHAANKLASRHARVWVCEVCEQAPAAVTCRLDAAALCASCDRDIHSANPLDRRHDRFPVVPFYVRAERPSPSSEEEAEAASWLLLPNPSDDPDEYKSAEDLFSDMDPCLDLGLISGESKRAHVATGEPCKLFSADGVVPVQSKSKFGSGPVVDGYPSLEMGFPGPKPFMYNFTSQSISQSVSSSSPDAGVVPDYLANASDSFGKSEAAPIPVSGLDREARVLRYREKRKNRRFEKTIRYASRKVYAETRPRIKGRFAKRSELEVKSLFAGDASYGVVPTF